VRHFFGVNAAVWFRKIVNAVWPEADSTGATLEEVLDALAEARPDDYEELIEYFLGEGARHTVRWCPCYMCARVVAGMCTPRCNNPHPASPPVTPRTNSPPPTDPRTPATTVAALGNLLQVYVAGAILWRHYQQRQRVPEQHGLGGGGRVV
jgi:hypothetical protein